VLQEGDDAPPFALPGFVDGEFRTVDVADAIGGNIVVLAFYPADFSPACGGGSCDLTQLDLFTMQRDIDVFAVGPDSVFSHRAFAEEYGLSMPLVSDTHGEAIDAYDVRMEEEAEGNELRINEEEQLLARRAVFVVDQNGEIKYTWATEDLEERPDVEAVREAVADVGGDPTAVGRYHVGHAHYVEGRRAFTSAMDHYESRDWLLAQSDLERAMEEFQEAADHFRSAASFAESGDLGEEFERAQEKATLLWQASEWLGDSAGAYARGNGRKGDQIRDDTEAPLESARGIDELSSPDEIRSRVTDGDWDDAADEPGDSDEDREDDLGSSTDVGDESGTAEGGDTDRTGVGTDDGEDITLDLTDPTE